MARVLLIGQTGQVGQELQKTLSPIGELIGFGREELDLTKPESIRQAIRSTQPHLIVNAAAYTAVDKAETEVDLAYAVNQDAPAVMAELAQQMRIPLIHISTDYVFDGNQSTPYLETDKPNPMGVYGKSKLAGEARIQEIHASSPTFPYVILRTAWVYGAYGKGNFVKTMLRLGAERQEVRVVADQIGTPTWAAAIAEAIGAVSTQMLLPEAADSLSLSGIYHFTNSGAASWYDFAVAIFEEAAAMGIPLKLERVVPITTPEYPTPVKRPPYSVLDCQKISKFLPAPPQQWRQGLRQMLTQYVAHS